MLQWGHRFTSVETIFFLSLLLFFHIASMGPPIYIGGNSQSHLPHVQFQGSFNGATDLHRWKHRVIGFLQGLAMLLQWGHRFTSVETSRIPRTVQENRSFNGATDLHRWKPPFNVLMTAQGCPLQWGHRFTSVETVGIQILLMHIMMLQWGHRFTSVETFCGWRHCVERHGFNGATDLHRWKLQGQRKQLRRAMRFNGATDLHRWKPIPPLI